MKWSTSVGRVVGTLTVLAVGAAAMGCGGQTVFEDKTALKIVGDAPPPPPPPPPKPAPEPPKRVEIVKDKIVINEKIQFAYDAAVIKKESFSLLDEIVKILKDNPHVKKVQIEGHASLEKDTIQMRMYNKALSDKRAKAVMKYLTEHGIEESRLVAKGFGNEKPLESNDTEAGREKNRRVEFNILEQDAK